MILKKTEAQVRAREKAFREQLIQERDAEIEVIIDRLERESGSSTSDATRRYRMDIERIKAETATEIKEVCEFFFFPSKYSHKHDIVERSAQFSA